MPWRSEHRFTMVILAILLLFPIFPFSNGNVEGTDQTRTDPRYDSIVVIDPSSIRFHSGGITQWGPYCFGVVNRTTVIETKLMNTNNAPIIGIEVNLTMYWYEAARGDSYDKGRVMHKDSAIASVLSGEGTLSSAILFNWVPQFAGAYVMNISIKVPGDPRPFSNRTLAAGIPYKTQTRTITDGLWVATEFWNLTKMDGWSAYSDLGEPGVQWHISNHSLSSGYGNLHTPGGSLWVGYDGTGLSPTNGSYSLVSPILNLTRFNPEGWDYYVGGRRTQTYLLYKYRGNISAEGPSGEGAIYHWVRERIDGSWDPWEPLMDPKDHWVNLTGNTTNAIWELSRRPYLHGDIDFIGIDLGDHRGDEVQIRMEYIPSGHSEPGYVIDDIILIGKEPVDVTPFTVSADTSRKVEADPGSNIQYEVELIPRSRTTENDIHVRVEAIDGSEFLNIGRDISIEPGIVTLQAGMEDSISSVISISLPPSSPSGNGWLTVRVIGGGVVKDLTFEFMVNSRRKLELDVTGVVSGELIPGKPNEIRGVVENLGNVEEEVFLTFLTKDDLKINIGLGSRILQPSGSWDSTLSISVPTNSEAGQKRGFFLLSSSPPPPDAIDSILSDDLRSGWHVFEVGYNVGQTYSIELFAPSQASTYGEIKDPGSEGTKTIDYNLVIRNNGNGKDRITFTSPGWREREDMVLILPENYSIPAGTTNFTRISIMVMYPVPLGIYNIVIQAHSDGFEDEKDNIVDLTLSIGRAPVSSGIYLLNGSLDVKPTELVLGREAKVVFTVRSFGFLDENDFNVNLWLNGAVVLTQQFEITQTLDRVYEIPLLIDEPGNYLLEISLSEGRDLGPNIVDLVTSMSTEIKVGFIDLEVADLHLAKESERIEHDDDIRPGSYDISVRIDNEGNATANLAVITLITIDLEQGIRWNSTLNITDLAPNGTRELVFKSVIFDKERDYEVIVTIDDSNRWIDTAPENDLGSLDVKVGSIPPHHSNMEGSTLEYRWSYRDNHRNNGPPFLPVTKEAISVLAGPVINFIYWMLLGVLPNLPNL